MSLIRGPRMGWWRCAIWELDLLERWGWRPGALRPAGVADGGAGDWDRPSLGVHGEGEAAVAMGKVFAFLQRVSNLTDSRGSVDLEVVSCLQSHCVSKKNRMHRIHINPVLKNTAN